MTRLSTHLYDGDVPIFDLTGRLSRPAFTTGEHGFETFSAELIQPLPNHVVTGLRGKTLKVMAGSAVVWEGRVVTTGNSRQNLRISAVGYWTALSDVPYIELWSTEGFEQWVVSDQGTASRYQTQQTVAGYEIMPRKNEVFAASGTYFALEITVPTISTRQFRRIFFDYTIVDSVSKNYELMVQRRPTSGGSSTEATIIAGSGSQDVTFSATDRVWLVFRPSTAHTYTGETGDTYALISNLRIQTTDSATVLLSDVAADMVSFVNGVNSAELSASSAQIETTSLDRSNLIVLDRYPAEVLAELASDERVEVGIYEGKRLYLRAPTTTIDFEIDCEPPRLEESLEGYYNSVYATFEDGRTANVGEADNLGFVRRAALSVDTESSAIAEAARDMHLNDVSANGVRATLIVKDSFRDKWRLRAGMRVRVRNVDSRLPVGAREFVIGRTNYQMENDRMEISPRRPMPELPLLIAATKR